jgi:large subunit ribosomal protein L1
MSRDSKRFQEAKKAIEPGRFYAPLEAAKLLKGVTTANFDETVEVHIKLGVNPRHAEQQVRGTVMLPHGTTWWVLKTLAAQIEGGMLDFDAAVATPDMMGVVGKLGRVLGPRGLMPSPKAGTVTFDVAKAVQDMKAGKVEYRTDKFGVVHLIVGKKSFEAEQLVANYSELLGEIVRAKPAAAKGKYLRSITMTTTMGPGVPLDTSKTRALLEDET